MEETTQNAAGWRVWLPGALLCLLIAMSAIFYGGGVEAFYGPSSAEREGKKQELMANRNRLLLQLSKCRNYATMKNDGYICGGSSLIYKNLEGSLECQVAEEAAKELGLASLDFSISPNRVLKPSYGK